MVKDVSFDESTGVFTITYLNGATIQLDTKLEKLAVNFSWDATTQELIIILDDGTEQRVDMSTLITVYEFLDSETLAFSVDSTGKVSATIKSGSITEDMLQPDYLADIKVEVAKTAVLVEAAENSANLSKSYAVGTEGSIRENDALDNARYYKEQAERIAEGLKGSLLPMGTIAFADLPDTAGTGYMYNISDEFTTSERFKEGTGNRIPAGTNVYYTADGFWDCMAGSPVTGIKGCRESTYRRGNVDITPENIGLENVDNTSDADKPISTAVQQALSKKQDLLGFTPIQQGGGAGQGTNKIYIGWGTDAKLHLQVDGTDLGTIALSSDLGAYLPLSGGTMTGHIRTNAGAIYPTDGNVYIKSQGYADYLSNILNGKLSITASCNKNWNWSGMGGQPTWVWGGEDGTNMYVYNPTQFNVRSSKYLLSGLSGAGFSCILTNKGNFRPDEHWDENGNASNANGVIGLGVADGYRWKQVCAASSAIVTSDKNLKKDIKELEEWHYQLFLKLIPCSFLFKDGESGRTHVGFISQDVENALSELGKEALDFAGFCKDKRHKYYIDADGNEVEEEILDEDGNPVYVYSLRYEEFIALITYAVQRTITRVDKQEEQMKKQEKRISALEQKLAAL